MLIYLLVEREGSLTAQDISKFLLIEKTHVYKILRDLVKKGYIIKSNSRPVTFHLKNG